ncbi:hypothetical protein EJB05_46078, partial [Eragrostis curvula]
MNPHCAARQSSPWRDLQPELLDLILERLTSLADRVRLRAVCRPWRRGTRLESLPQPFPWSTLLDGAFLDIPGGEIHRVPLPDDACCCHGSVGNWLFLQHRGNRLSLMNLFSKQIVPIPDVSTIWGHREVNQVMPRYATYPLAFKLVHLSSQLVNNNNNTSPGSSSLFAVLITDRGFESTVLIYRADPVTATAFRDIPNREHLFNVAFHCGKLYAISARKLFVMHVDDCSDASNKPPRVSSVEAVMNYKDDPETKFKSFSNKGYRYYWLVGVSATVRDFCRAEETRTFSFEIFEADLNAGSSCGGRWRRVDTLDGQALFVGTYSSKFLPASECGAQGDCIYFLCDYDQRHSDADPFRDCDLNGSSSCGGRWRRVDTLEGQALFVGTYSSRFLPASECGAREDCIYFLCDYDQRHSDADPFRDCGVFDMKTEVITPLLPDAMVVRRRGCMGRPACGTSGANSKGSL